MAKSIAISKIISTKSSRLRSTRRRVRSSLFTASVCDDCMKKNICKPSREYHFACQWKNVKGKQRIAARDEWGIPKITPKE